MKEEKSVLFITIGNSVQIIVELHQFLDSDKLPVYFLRLMRVVGVVFSL